MKKNLILYAVLIGYLFLNNFYLMKINIPYYNEVINPFFWIIIALVALFLSSATPQRIKDASNKTKSLIIALLIYIIIYFLTGLVFGYQKTPYAKNIFSIITNLWSFCSVIVFQEIIRNAMIRLSSKKYNLFLITLIFTFLNITLLNISHNFVMVKDSFIFISSVFIPLLAANSLLTYLSLIGGVKLPIIYRLFMVMPELILPILPNLDWFMISIFGLVLPLFVFIYLNYIHLSKNQVFSKRDRNNYKTSIYIPCLIFIIILISFVAGVFKYSPIAIVSGSMEPTFNRGDAAIVKKLTEEEKHNLKKGDIIQFTDGTKFVLHRIVGTSNDEFGNMLFITKGDANNVLDNEKLTYDKIYGKVSFTIPYIGYPSVWLNEFIR